MPLKYATIKLTETTAAMSMTCGTVVLQQHSPLSNERVDVFLTAAQLRQLADWAEAQTEA